MERAPEVVTGKMLIAHGVKAYGNSRMLTHHYTQMLKTVIFDDVWTYPELTASLTGKKDRSSLSEDAIELIDYKEYKKEKQKDAFERLN